MLVVVALVLVFLTFGYLCWGVPFLRGRKLAKRETSRHNAYLRSKRREWIQRTFFPQRHRKRLTYRNGTSKEP